MRSNGRASDSRGINLSFQHSSLSCHVGTDFAEELPACFKTWKWYDLAHMSSEIIFEVREDEVDGGYNASALGYGIHTQGETLQELRTMVKDVVTCYFDDEAEAPNIIRLHFVRDEVMAR